MYILDSDIAIWILRKHKLLVSAIERLSSQNFTSISAITVAEVYKNAFPTELSGVEDFFKNQWVIPVSLEIAREAGLYWNQFHKKLVNISTLDCMIAATARLNGLTVVTLNTRHFPMPDIKVLNPLK
ncbi:MAG: putative ribonuclease VapC [Candidatus Amesbacteria bacterium GW2011_GWA2_47_11b]|uniref:Putative ribonuclease VapC n=3 Tax=Candidatus Amesiibacteriota TaxID=1752730 RepID=A0A0G1SF51_9BACT|nr:MAG: putative ribonuclease VapC [Candidatus Amesbacteria bacterium GW2011_GWA2_47_11b]KKU68074.1 MAG: putative ribonuclease VapC [Candidatus Amesbacteria bacterium GW2011_GWA1_47_20]KKU84849.1 MAG: putative ribonuclease VapC [Candidatus Amesbacteria bacterium GW2011_GWC2_47_8]HCH59330.1 VapC toxin family PIN domain ribonuclease [Candidatus Zambryskibacteria bacterium]